MSDTHATETLQPCVAVTGANRNIGAHLAARFLDEGFGVVAHYRSETAAIERLAARGARVVRGSFDDAAACTDIAERLAAAAPSLRAIIHNASSFAPTAADIPAAATQFQDFFAVHMLAPYILNTHLAAHLDGTPEAPADIIHITDIYADNPAPAQDLYCATKAGLQNLSLAFAKRYAPRIKVNAIQPGPISFEAWHDENHRSAVLEATPLGRMGSPEAIYAAVRAIMANDYQTGAVIPVDGGRRLGRG